MANGYEVRTSAFPSLNFFFLSLVIDFAVTMLSVELSLL
jgi:hypothetical protein